MGDVRAYRLKDREAWIGRDAQACARRRSLIIKNVRFLVRAAAWRSNVAGKQLADALKTVSGQWRERFGLRAVAFRSRTATDI